ncbi:MAG: UDP-2,4-diacetamido-2,4,6-trideoxy-beta-L-altropyranose hydrolase [Sideroxyarcus sp.]|nr:UDP-2,4-diacetamido-2,4,6-trideoxy-beta-L-altropyranose hydrolase [Sideroxyarcus sp.]
MSIEVVFRADAYTEIGTGHVMRCLALADACRNAGVATHFVGRIDDEVLRRRIRYAGHPFTEWTADVEDEWLGHIDRTTGWVVLDGYGFGRGYQRMIRDAGPRLLVLDDMAHLEVYEADIILNQNLSADAAAYHLARETRLLMGPRFALLRKEFIGKRPSVRGTSADRLLITLGGSDPEGVCLQVTEALSKIHGRRFEVRLIAGSSNPHLVQLEAAAGSARSAGHGFEVKAYTDDMPGEMAWADLAIIAGGSTSLEVTYMGLPSLVLTLADNQIAIAEAMQSLGVAESLGWHDRSGADELVSALLVLASDAQRMRAMTLQGQALVDGMGAERVVRSILS